MVHGHFNLSPFVVLCGITHMHIMLPDVLDYTLCRYRVWHSVSLMKTSSRVGVRKYLTEYYFLRVHAFYHVLLGAFSLYALILLWQKMAVDLHSAHKKTDWRATHKALLTCFLLLCITQIITCAVTKNSSHTVHES